MLEIEIFSTDSPIYAQELELRDALLRQPIGLKLSDKDTALDASRIHVGALDDDMLVGCLLITPMENGSAQLLQMAVSEEYRGNGVGASLLQAAEEACTEAGLRHITLNARATAVGFYQRYGYSVCSDEFESVGIPHYKMQKRIP